jgi:hypothetical protein
VYRKTGMSNLWEGDIYLYEHWAYYLRCLKNETGAPASQTTWSLYSGSHSWVAPENVGLQKEQKYNTFACHTCNVWLYVLGIRKKEVGNTKRKDKDNQDEKWRLRNLLAAWVVS